MDDMAAVRRALSLGADVLMVDLELPDARRQAARDLLGEMTVPSASTLVFVRVAARDRVVDQELDLAATVRPGVAGIIIPDAAHPDDVTSVADQLDVLERRAGLPAGQIGIIPLPETALAIRRYYEILVANPRVWAAWFPGTDGGDLARDVGYRWTATGTEFLYIRSKVAMDAQAAGLGRIFDVAWRDSADIEGFRRDTRVSRALGYTGRLAFTAEQVAIANEIYGAEH